MRLIDVLVAMTLAGCTVSAAPVPGASVPEPAPSDPLLTDAAYGAKLTVPFTATGPWTVVYGYDCANFGVRGDFILSVEQDDIPVAVAVTEIGAKGQNEASFASAGTFRLLVNTQCSWSVRVEE